MARGPVDVDSCFLLTVNLQDNAHILAAIDCQASALGNSRCVGLGPGQTQAPALQAWSPTFRSHITQYLNSGNSCASAKYGCYALAWQSTQVLKPARRHDGYGCCISTLTNRPSNPKPCSPKEPTDKKQKTHTLA